MFDLMGGYGRGDGFDIYPLTVTLTDFTNSQIRAECRRFTVNKRFK